MARNWTTTHSRSLKNILNDYSWSTNNHLIDKSRRLQYDSKKLSKEIYTIVQPVSISIIQEAVVRLC